MAVPAHDTRDYEFAKKFNLPIIQVVDGENVDLHLGKGHSVYVYDYEDDLTFVEKRDVEIDEDSKQNLK